MTSDVPRSGGWRWPFLVPLLIAVLGVGALVVFQSDDPRFGCKRFTTAVVSDGTSMQMSCAVDNASGPVQWSVRKGTAVIDSGTAAVKDGIAVIEIGAHPNGTYEFVAQVLDGGKVVLTKTSALQLKPLTSSAPSN